MLILRARLAIAIVKEGIESVGTWGIASTYPSENWERPPPPARGSEPVLLIDIDIIYAVQGRPNSVPLVTSIAQLQEEVVPQGVARDAERDACCFAL